MEKFTRLTGVAAPLPMVNVDTDMVIPKTYLKVTERTGLGKHLFAEMRFNADGSERPDFVLNRPAWRQAEILVAFENFGCGSSREHAPWALRDFGIRCVIAPSFADIFFNNCFKNGILPLVLPKAVCVATDRRCRTRRQCDAHHRPRDAGADATRRRAHRLRGRALTPQPAAGGARRDRRDRRQGA